MGITPADSSGLDQVVEQAEREASQLGHGYVGAVHLLLAIAAEGGQSAVLQRLGLDASTVRSRVYRSISRGHDFALARPFPLTTRARDALRRARAEAQAHDLAQVRAEDVLVGIGVEESIAGAVLRSLGVTAEALHAAAYPH